MGGDRLNGANAVVTGASRGIGRAIAEALLREGARVAVLARGASQLRDLAQELGGRARPVKCDVSNPDDVRAAVAEITGWFNDVPHILVNNAGSFALAPLAHVGPAEFAATIDTNLVAPFRLMRAFLPGMIARRSGHIVTIGSIADRHIFRENGAYAVSKHGVRALHEVLRLETRGTGVRATLISPGPVDTALWDPINPDTREGFTPRALMLNTAAVADAVIYAVTQPRSVNIDELRLSHS